MRISALLVSLLLVQAATGMGQAPEAKASVEGIVLRIGSGEAIGGVRVTLTKAPTSVVSVPSGSVGSRPTSAGASVSVVDPAGWSLYTGAPSVTLPVVPPVVSDTQGKFALRDLEPGSYILTFGRNGYVRQEYGQRFFTGAGTPITVSAGQVRKDIAMRLTPTGSVSGRIRDSVGQPKAGVPVQLLQSSYNDEGLKALKLVAAARTNDRGEYRFYFVTPGVRYVSAGEVPGAGNFTDASIGISLNEPTEVFAYTYYPAGSSAEEAGAVNVAAGVDLSGIDFTVRPQQLYRIRGRITDSPTGAPPSAVSIGLHYSSVGGDGASSGGGEYNPDDGSFSTRSIVPGSYGLVVSVSAPLEPASTGGVAAVVRPSGYAAVTVGNGDTEGVSIAVPAAASISGRLSVGGESLPVAEMGKMRISLHRSVDGPWSVATRLSPWPAAVGFDGTFKLDTVGDGDYRVAVTGMSGQFYVKEARFGGADVLNQPLHFASSQPALLDFIISPHTGQISGTITDDNLQPASGIQAVLIPDRMRDRIELYRAVVSDENGHFNIEGIPPGDYGIFAWEAIKQYAWFDPAMVKRAEPKASRIHVAESSKQSVDVKLIPAASSQ